MTFCETVNFSSYKNLKASSKELWQDVIAVSLLLLFGTLLRLITLDVPKGSDDLVYWITASWFSDCDTFTANQHSSRLGIVIPVLLSQKLFGTHPSVTHIIPLVFYNISILSTFLMAKELGNRKSAILAGLLMILLPQMGRNADQILPGVFEAGYLSLAVLSFVYHLKTKKNIWLIFSAVALFLGYTTRFTCLFLLPAFLFVMYKKKYQLKLVVMFFSVLVVGYVFEHLYFYLHGFPLGRGQMLLEWATIGAARDLDVRVVGNIFHFFRRYTLHYAGIYWFITFLYLVPSVTAVIYYKKTRQLSDDNGELTAVLAILVSFLTLFTFFVTSIDPILIQPPRKRFFTVFAPLIFTVISVALINTWQLTWRCDADKRVPSYGVKEERGFLPWKTKWPKALLLLLLIPLPASFIFYNSIEVKKGILLLSESAHALQVEDHYYNQISQAYKKGELILAKGPQYSALKAVRFYFIKRSDWGAMDAYRKQGYWIKERDFVEHDVFISGVRCHVLVNRSIYPNRESLIKKVQTMGANRQVYLISGRYQIEKRTLSSLAG